MGAPADAAQRQGSDYHPEHPGTASPVRSREVERHEVPESHRPARMNAVLSPSTPDDQSRTWDGRVLDTKEKVLEFLAEVEEARASGRSLHPVDNQP